jgi:hypothetical protein
MMPSDPAPNKCPECGAMALYRLTDPIGGLFNPLPGLGDFLQYAEMRVVVCSECGLIRFYSSKEARKKLPKSERWRKIE